MHIGVLDNISLRVYVQRILHKKKEETKFSCPAYKQTVVQGAILHCAGVHLCTPHTFGSAENTFCDGVQS